MKFIIEILKTVAVILITAIDKQLDNIFLALLDNDDYDR